MVTLEPSAVPADPNRVTVELVVGLAARQLWTKHMVLPLGTTVAQAVHHSGVYDEVPGLDAEALAQGHWSVTIWGRKERASHVLRDRDRIEILRGILVDPKEARRVRHRAQGPKPPKQQQPPRRHKPKA